MAEVLLTQAVNQAEEAIESGNYGGAIETCQRILGQFPEFAGAHRIMGEAYAEQGDVESARAAFHRTLERDPQSIPAHLGLGLLAEDAGDLEAALAYYQVAWEIDPRRRDLREHVSRISQELYGADGRLYLTRAALASLHFHAGRWDRTVSESAQVLQEYSTRIDVQVRLAEALWRRGDDEQAKQVCRTTLRALPSAVVPLLILADIHRHEGDHAGAADFLKQARDIDPDGVRAADLIMVGLDDQADFLAVDAIPTIDDQLVHEEPARYAPAPDFTAGDAEDTSFVDEAPEPEDVEVVTSAPEMPAAEAGGVQPFRWEDIGDEDLEASDLDEAADDVAAGTSYSESPSEFSLPTDEELEQARPSDQHPAGYTGMLDSLDSEGMQPFDPTGGASEPMREALQEAVQPTEPDQSASDDFWDEITLPSDDELERAKPRADEASGYTDMLESLDSDGVEPFDPFGDEQPAQARPEPEAEDDLMSELSLPSDDELEQARPSEERPSGFTGMLNSLDAEGMEPFDPAVDEDTPGTAEPDSLSEVEAEQPEIAAEPEVPENVEDDSSLELDWSGIDEEIESAIPGEMPRGYTDELRGLDDVGIEPFAFEEDEEAETDEIAPGAEGSEELGDELDFDQLAAGWELEAEGSPEEIGGSGIDEVDSIDVVFSGEHDEHFPETRALESEPMEDVDEFDAVPDTESFEESAETAPAPPVDSWDVDDELEELMAGTDSLVTDWPGSEPEVSLGSESDAELFVETVHELAAMDPFEDARDKPAPAPGSGGLVGMNISADRLGLDEALITRAREAKEALVREGRISGNVPLTRTAVSLESLRGLVESDPLNIDHHIALASALVQEHPDEALEQFRWVYRNAPDRGVEIVHDLALLIDVMREREVGVHRLLGALYRRHGDWLAAATHYEESLVGKRRHSAQ